MKSILFVALVLFGFIGVFAQERTISKAEFEAVSESPNKWAPTRWTGKSYRMITTTESKISGKVPQDLSSKITIEFASPTISHFISESRMGSKISRNESIRIGDKTYKRNGDEAWIEGTVEVNPTSKKTETTSPAPSNNQADSQIEYKYLGSEKLNNQTTNVYAWISKKNLIDPSTNKEKISTSIAKYWFTEDGILLKEDRVMEHKTGEVTIYNRLTTVWELDPNITVIAPILN